MSECPDKWKCWRCLMRFYIGAGRADTESAICPECGLKFWSSYDGHGGPAKCGINEREYEKLQSQKRAV